MHPDPRSTGFSLPPMKRFTRRIRALFGRSKAEQEMTEELALHLEMLEDANRKLGMGEEEARRQARRQFGHLEGVKEELRDRFCFSWIEALHRDCSYAIRGLSKNRGFTFVAVGTLALGIGASSAIFSLVETFLLRPLPYFASGELVTLSCSNPGIDQATVGISVPEFEDLRDRSGLFSELSIVWPTNCNLTGTESPQRIEAMAVSPSFFRLLGANAARGRVFGSEEEKIPGWAPGVVLSHRAWVKYFGSDENIVGRQARFDYDPGVVIGVMPEGFRHPGRTLSDQVDMWYTGGMRDPPFGATPTRNRRLVPLLIGRLAPGLSIQDAQARLAVFAAKLRDDYSNDYPKANRWTPRIEALQSHLTGEVRPVLWLLFASVALVFLICCATLANLLLVRASGRRQEISLRLALGATRATIVRQLCVESLLISLCGGAFGLMLASWLPVCIVRLVPEELPQVNELAVNGSLLFFTITVACFTGLFVGLVPALQASRLDLVTGLKAGGRSGGSDSSSGRLRACFASVQVALSLVLLTGSGLLLKSFWNVLQIDPGFSAKNVVLSRIWLPPPVRPDTPQQYNNGANRIIFARNAVARMSQIPGVKYAAIANGQCVPLSGDGSLSQVRLEGETSPDGAQRMALASNVSPDYFATLGIPVLQGRPFTDADQGDTRTILVDQAAADRFWKTRDVLGKRIATGSADKPQWWTVVGVVGNVKSGGLDIPDSAHVYFPIFQRTDRGLTILVKTEGDPALVMGALQGVIRSIDLDLPIYGLKRLDELVSQSLAQRRFAVVILAAFATVSLLLSILGLYGVLSLSTAHRTCELGLRIALGAHKWNIYRIVMQQGLLIVVAGVSVGLGVTLLFAQTLRGFLYETKVTDFATLSATVFLLSGAAMLASWLPARRAARIDPLVALRGE